MFRGTVVGALACQKDSYLKSLTTSVLTCVAVKNGNYEVELQDTILFPEGGGQPCDLGIIEVVKGEKAEVIDVQRKNLRAVHLVDKEIPIGSEVKVSVDWRRRLDHMQQHTGQHLFSAILDKYDLPTLSWNMGDVVNYIEIERQLTEEEVVKIGAEVNDEIFNNTAIKIASDDAIGEDAATDNEKGVMRVVHIGELDANPCCGTHLSSVGQIKGISILNQTKGKGGKWKINFVCGDRIFKFLSQVYETNRKACAILNSSMDKLDIKAEEAVAQGKKNQQKVKKMGKELALVCGEKLKAEVEGTDKQMHVFFREDGDLDFLNWVYNEIKESVADNRDKIAVLVSSDGAVVVCGGNEENVMKAVEEISGRVKGTMKGGYNKKQGRYQGRITGGVSEKEVVP